MINDFNDEVVGKIIETDICIIGAGAAGITLAHALIDSGLNVTILESGGYKPDAGTLDLNELTVNKDIDANIVGKRSNPNLRCRQRHFGGTTNHWTGWCRPLDEIDFAERDWVPNSGWPITRKDLDPYYTLATGYCDISRPIFDVAHSGLSDLPDYLPNKLESIFWSFSSPTRFGPKYRAELEAAENTHVLLNANVVNIVTGSSESSVQSLVVRSLQGKEASVVAKRYVLATGALENTRLLLASDKKNPAGVGNESGLIGKNFQNHPHLNVGTLVSSDPKAISKLYGKRDGVNEGENGFRLGLGATNEIQAERETLNFGAVLKKNSTKSVARSLWQDMKRFKWPEDFGDEVAKLVGDLVGQKDSLNNHQVYMFTEQAPNDESCIRLTDERDALDMPRIRMDWRLNQLDKHTVQQATQVIAEEVGRLEIGRLNIRDWVLEEGIRFPNSLWGGCHQIGTTRMSQSAQDGVVDKNCRMHSVDNLYLASSSVFPTGGHTPPTLTIVALALRLADHLKTTTS